MRIDVIDENDFIDRKRVKKIVAKVLNKLELRDRCEICVTFVDDNEMRELNRRYRGVYRTTDVLSFPQDGKLLLGDVVISFDTAKRQSDMYNNDLIFEIKKLVVHGILHLLGYDHKKKREKKLMFDKEKELLKEIENL